MYRTAISVTLLVVGSFALGVGFMLTMWATDPSPGPVRSAIPAIVLFVFGLVLLWPAARLWSKWRAGLAGGLAFNALWMFQLSRQIPPDQETGHTSRNYLISAVVLLVAGVIAGIWHRISSRPRD